MTENQITAEDEIHEVLKAHRVITDGLYYGTGWCETCGNLDDGDQETHQSQKIRTLFEDMADENDELHNLMMKQGRILTNTANALRGDPPPLTHWSHHDLAELVGTVKADAWDRGFATGKSRAMRCMSDEPELPLNAPNPYRDET